ncbi:MAG TPA: response regulator, partial [Alphaproteobacteria bacterium]|nr:response regulator [Alphaproteobacteria bacterium]
DGLAFVAALRRHPDPALSRVPVLILTIDDTPATVLSAARCGADGYLLKPVMPETLRHHVERALEGRAGAVV